MENFNINQLVFNSDGLIPTIAQEKSTNEILMLAYSNQNSIQMTIETKKAHFWSRSKKKLWQKGETSGNKLNIINIYTCLLYTSPSPRDVEESRMPSSA